MTGRQDLPSHRRVTALYAERRMGKKKKRHIEQRGLQPRVQSGNGASDAPDGLLRATDGSGKSAEEARSSDLPDSANSLHSTAPNAAPGFDAIERLLPKLILFPSAGRKLSSQDRKAVERCVRLCEELLALKPQAERLERHLSRFAEGSEGREAQESGSTQLNSLLALVQEAAGPIEKMGLAERTLHERRTHLCHAFEKSIPRDLQEWIALWDRKIDEQVGEEYLRWLAHGAELLQRQAREWVEAVRGVRPGSFGLLSRLRSLKWSAHVRKGTRNITSMRREVTLRRERLKQAEERTASLCGVLAAFLKAPALNAGSQTRLVRKLLFLELERDLTVHLGQEITAREALLASRRRTLSDRAEALSRNRRYVADLEAAKNLRLVELYAASCANVKEAVPAATVRRMDAVFEEIGTMEEEWNGRVEDALARVHRLKREMERLAGVIDEYAERHFGSELRVPALSPLTQSAFVAEDARGQVVRPARLHIRQG